MALIEIDGLPFYKMVDLSMANCECHKQMVYRMVYNPKNEPLHLQSSGVPFLDQLPKNSALVSQGKPPPQRCRNVFPGWLFGDMYLLFTQYFEAFATVLSMTWLFPRQKNW